MEELRGDLILQCTAVDRAILLASTSTLNLNDAQGSLEILSKHFASADQTLQCAELCNFWSSARARILRLFAGFFRRVLPPAVPKIVAAIQ